MSSRKRTLLVTALLTLLVAVSGCLGGTNGPQGDGTPSAEEIRENTVSAMEDVETATYEMQMTISAGGQDIEMNADGAIDRAAKLMRMNLSMDAGFQSLETTQYIKGNTSYMNLDGQWRTQDVSGQTPGEGFWSNNQFAQQTNALEGATVELNGTETVDGEETYRLDVEADQETVNELLQQQSGATGSLENVDISNVQFTQYVDTESNYIRKVEMQMDMTVQGQDATATMTMSYDNFNEDVTIEIPDAATS